MGIRLLEVGTGRVVFAMPASGWLSQEYGGVFGRTIALLGMSASSAAVQTTVERGTDFAALDMKINLLRPVHPDGQQLVATRDGAAPRAPARHRDGRGPPRWPARGRDHRHDRADPRRNLSRPLWRYQLPRGQMIHTLPPSMAPAFA